MRQTITLEWDDECDGEQINTLDKFFDCYILEEMYSFVGDLDLSAKTIEKLRALLDKEKSHFRHFIKEPEADFVDTAEKAAKIEIMSEKDAQATLDYWRMYNRMSEVDHE